MSEHQNFIRKDLGEGCTLCEDVHLPSGCICTVYFSPNSIYVISDGSSLPEKRYQELQELLGTSRIRMYLLSHSNCHQGIYDATTGQILELPEEALTDDITNWLGTGYGMFSSLAIERMIAKLKSADIQSRGFAVEENGDVFLLKNGAIHKASPVPSDQVYYATLFGGIFGVHRFFLGKPMSGIAYFLTGGGFLIGWMFDLIRSLAGIQKDSEKRYLFPLSNWRVKLLLLPLGLCASCLFFYLYLITSQALLSLTGNAMSNLVTVDSLTGIQNLVESFERIVPLE